jgi:hypothetical protein
MFIYMNERTFDRFKNTKSKLQFESIDIDETELCEMKDRLLQEEISLAVNTTTTTTTTTTSSKKSISQTIVDDASKP